MTIYVIMHASEVLTGYDHSVMVHVKFREEVISCRGVIAF